MSEKKLSHEEFVRKAVVSLRKEPYKGIHIVYSGFNEAFRQYFPGEDPREATAALEAQGVVKIVPKKGGAIMYLAEDAQNFVGGASALRRMGL
jgi:hypothetical protein